MPVFGAGADLHAHKVNESILTHLVQQQESNSLHLKWKTCCMSRDRKVRRRVVTEMYASEVKGV